MNTTDPEKSQMAERDIEAHDLAQPNLDLSKYITQQNELNKSVSVGL